jgi:hypothetical protein
VEGADRPVTIDVVTAHDIGEEFKDVVNLAFHEFFERRQYLPVEVKR